MSPFFSVRPATAHAHARRSRPRASIDRDRAELHAAFSFSARNGFLRNAAMISPSDRNRDLGRADRADVEPDRPMDARDRLRAEACRRQPLDALGVRLPRTERADVEAFGPQRGDQRRDRRSSDHASERAIARVAVEPDPRQRRVRPFGDHTHVRESARRWRRRCADRRWSRRNRPCAPSAASAWLTCTAPIDHEAQQAAPARSGNRLRPSCSIVPLLPMRNCLSIALGQRIGGYRVGLHQPLRAVGEIGDQHRGAPRAPLLVQRSRRSSFISRPSRHRPGCLPPQDRPTRQAVSSATPYSSVRGLPSPITSCASVTTSPSTQPPETEPRNCPRRRSRDGCRPAAAPSPRSPPRWRSPRPARRASSFRPARECLLRLRASWTP